MDVRLGEDDGTGICKELKKNLSIPIVLFSADTHKGNHFADCGANGFIEKPFDLHKFIDTVNSYTENA